MKSLKSKASRFFKDSPSQDEKVAISELGATDFDAGIQSRNVKKKQSRFFSRKHDKAGKDLLFSRSNASSPTVAESEVSPGRKTPVSPERDTPVFTEFFPPAPIDLTDAQVPSRAPSSARSSTKPESVQVKPHPSFATLRTKSSRFFRTNTSTTSLPPPPPIPQIPVDPEAPLAARRSILTPLHSARTSARNSRSSFVNLQAGTISVSRPVLIAQYSSLPIPENPVTVPFTKPHGPLPPRPSRPDSLDDDIIGFMQQSGTRMVLQANNRVSGSTASSSTPRSHSSSIEARLGLPSGYGTPRDHSLDSPLAARFPLDALQVRDSAGSVVTSRFSDARAGGYAGDGVDEADREMGPMEQYDRGKEGDWKLEKRISKGPNGNPGMLFRDRWGAFHFVADI